jgi:hypothetical protein
MTKSLDSIATERIKEDPKFKWCIIINSTVYFVIAYFFVVFSYNLFAIWLATTWFDFHATLLWHGYLLWGDAWTKDKMMIIFFLGNSIDLLIGFAFERLYKKNQRYKRGIKLFYMWTYIIAYSWFMGNFIVGALINFGIGTALRAFNVPFLVRLIFAFFAIFALVYIGYRGQKGIKLSASLYYRKLPKKEIKLFTINQILIPSILGVIILVIYKIPEINYYYYLDWLILSALVFYIIGVFVLQKNKKSIVFRSHREKRDIEEDLDGVEGIYHKKEERFCNIQKIAVAVFFILILAMRIGLNNGLEI